MDLTSLFDFSSAIYPELIVAILFITEVLKKVPFLKGLNSRILTAIVGVLCSAADIFFRDNFSFWAILISFAIANGFYSFIWKPLKSVQVE